ncbi:Iron-binding zinc finger CDGSH type [Nocardioides dokdonensis FR1436]|uniref:Iron-binding zinc finger CDGSH type n=1 Tax=Nocardioides dokdonensis FR1436 TaxID=1300347 RepID=A0A1A9GIZ1_9ACTN|nr:CDGSH iron-sulfur domain-containing protein [Nocardioides dokdonensis]ANH38046.1 Iron-binding zinc finger CDGSH type [Nocardioides dokdonensis FR1436]
MSGPPDRGLTEVTLCEDGPMLVRGPVCVEDEDGQRHVSSRPVTAVCRCGASSLKPWCDGSHKLLATGGPRARRLDRA